MSNKGVKTRMAQIYKKVCMLEASGIRYVPRYKRMRIKGYRKSQEVITYHHLEKKEDGGEATIENGALIKEYNHRWLHTLPPEQLDQVNDKLREYKLSVLQLGYQETKRRIECGELDFRIQDLSNEEEDYVVIKAYDDKEKQRPNKRQYTKKYREALDGR